MKNDMFLLLTVFVKRVGLDKKLDAVIINIHLEHEEERKILRFYQLSKKKEKLRA